MPTLLVVLHVLRLTYLLEENHHLTPSWNLSLAQCILLPKLGEDYGGGGGHVLAETFPSMRLTEINGD